MVFSVHTEVIEDWQDVLNENSFWQRLFSVNRFKNMFNDVLDQKMQFSLKKKYYFKSSQL